MSEEETPKKHKPNFTIYPNFLFDIMHDLSEGEIKVLNMIVRKTYGFGKDRDPIALSQMMKMTGLSKQCILSSREKLKLKKIIGHELVNGMTEYFIIEPEQVVQNLDLNKSLPVQITKQASPNEANLDVQNLDTQYKELQNKTTKEREEDTPAKFKEVIKAKDPLFPECQMSDGEMVMTVIQEFLDEHWNRMAVDRHSLRDCQDIFDKLREEDKVAQLKRCLILHTYGTIDGQKKTFWSKTPPQPKFLKLNWNDIYSAKIPIWFERGFTSQAEYEADIIKTQPSSHSGMDDLKRQFFSGPMVSQERADQFMLEMDELKEKINGKT